METCYVVTQTVMNVTSVVEVVTESQYHYCLDWYQRKVNGLGPLYSFTVQQFEFDQEVDPDDESHPAIRDAVTLTAQDVSVDFNRYI